MSQSKDKPRAIIFGASQSGISAFRKLADEYNILGFCDNDKSKAGSRIETLPVFRPDELQEQNPEIILIASEYFEQIHVQLKTLNLQARIEILPARIIKTLNFDTDEKIIKKAIEILHLITGIFNQEGIRYYVDAGTLLGIIRDDALIPWDDDLDLALDSIHLEKTQVVLEQQVLPALKTMTGTTWVAKQCINQTEFGAVKKGALRSIKLKPFEDNSNLPMMDLFIKYINGETMDYCLASRGIRMPAEHIQRLEQKTFKGQPVNIPNKVELYLERYYGDWSRPQRDWNLTGILSATVF